MDPQYEQRLRDEVIYLHSLWHQGPPTPRPAAAAVSHNLQPPKPTQSKKEKKRKTKRAKKSKEKPNNPTPETKSSPGVEWPSPTPPPATTSWPSLEAKPDAKPISLSPEEQSRVDSRNAHQHALKAVHEFFRSKHADDSDATDSNSDEDDDELMMVGDNGCGDYGFFMKVLKEDTLLKGFYEKNFVKGEFSCLVCGGLRGKGTGKKFKGCLALVQHSISIAKTKKKRAHRAFGQAVCKVLGWDIDQLPSVVSAISGKSCQTEGNSSIIVDNNVNHAEGNTGEVVPESGLSIGTVVLPNGDEGDMTSSKCLDADNNVEDLSAVHPHIVEEPAAAEGLTSNSLTCLDADKNLEAPLSDGLTNNSLTFHGTDNSLEDPAILHPHIIEEPTEEALTCNTLTLDNTAKSMEDPGVVHSNSVEEPTTEVLTSDLQMDNNTVLADEQNEAAKNEN